MIPVWQPTQTESQGGHSRLHAIVGYKLREVGISRRDIWIFPAFDGASQQIFPIVRHRQLPGQSSKALTDKGFPFNSGGNAPIRSEKFFAPWAPDERSVGHSSSHQYLDLQRWRSCGAARPAPHEAHQPVRLTAVCDAVVANPLRVKVEHAGDVRLRLKNLLVK